MSPLSYAGKTHDLLGPNDRFRLNDRQGTVFEVRPEGYFVLWDPEIDEKVAGKSQLIPRSIMDNANTFARLVVLRRDDEVVPVAEGDGRAQRSPKERTRERYKKAHALAADKMIAKGLLRPVRADFVAKRKKIGRKARKIYEGWEAASDPERPGKRRSGAMVPHTKPKSPCGFDPSTNGRWMFDIYRRYAAEMKKKPEDRNPNVLFDDYSNCGHAAYHCDEVMDIMCSVVGLKLNEDRVSITSICGSVQAALRAENKRREEDLELGPKLKIAAYDAIRSVIHQIAPIDHMILTRGKKFALANLHSVGTGIVADRALQRVEIDECKIDLMLLMTSLGLFDKLTDAEKEMLGLNGKTRRVWLSMAIDVHTRCIVGFKIVPENADSPLRDTVEMIYFDKGSITDALGCVRPWCQGGKTSSIVLDRGAKYITDEAYDVLAGLGICNLGAPAGKAWLRPFIERLFRIVNGNFVTFFSGRTFHNVVARGRNDASGRASLDLEGFCKWLVRWIVDIYHETPHEGLDWRTPNEAWAIAIKVHRPRTYTNGELRRMFGRNLGEYKIRQNGVMIQPVHYMTEEFARVLLTRRLTAVEVIYWEGDTGAIEVKIGPDEWMTVTAADEKWIGSTYSDVLASRERKKRAIATNRPSRDAAILAIDAEARERLALLQVAKPRATADDINQAVDEFTRFTKTARGTYDGPEYLDLLDGEVTDDVDLDEAHPEAGTPSQAPASPIITISDFDLME